MYVINADLNGSIMDFDNIMDCFILEVLHASLNITCHQVTCVLLPYNGMVVLHSEKCGGCNGSSFSHTTGPSPSFYISALAEKMITGLCQQYC